MTTQASNTPAVTGYPLTDLLSWTAADQLAIVRKQICPPDATDQEFMLFVEVAKARRLNPLLKQIYFIRRYKSVKDDRGNWRKEPEMSIQTSIDSFYLTANRTGQFDGIKVWTEGSIKDGNLVAKATVWRKDCSKPFEVECEWEEFAQLDKDGNAIAMWKKMPKWMLKKVAEARCLAKAFPEDLGGLYTNDEMPPAEQSRPVTVMQPQPINTAIANHHLPVVTEEPEQPQLVIEHAAVEPIAEPWRWQLQGTAKMSTSYRGRYLHEFTPRALKLSVDSGTEKFTREDLANIQAALEREHERQTAVGKSQSVNAEAHAADNLNI